MVRFALTRIAMALPTLLIVAVSVVVLIGVIVLAGIVVNNAIVLVDYILTLRRRGMAKRDAIVEACSVRLRPVLMTASVAILGLVPMLISSGVGAETQRPLATVVVGGLLSATLLTLFLLPVLYEWLETRAERKNEEATP